MSVTIAIDARRIADFGIGTYVRGLVGALARLDRERRYLLLAGPEGPEALPHLPGNFRWHEERAPGYSVRELFAVSRTLRRQRVDLFHAPHYVLPLRLPCPAVVTVHDLVHLRFPAQRSPLERVYARWMIGRATRLARRVLTVSAASADELARRFAVPAERLRVTPNGVDDAFRAHPDPPAERAALARLGLEPGYLLFVGNPKPHKNLERLLAAYAEVRAARPEAPALVIAGERDPARSPLGGWIAARGLGASVRRVGHVAEADLAALYRGATLLVHPALWEGFGLPVAEAMACGTPVVAAARGALPEIAGDAALLVDPERAGEIAAAVIALLDDPGRRAELARRGRARVERYRWSHCARATLDAYLEALAAPEPGR